MTFAKAIPHLLAGKVVKRDDYTSGQVAHGWAITGPDKDDLRCVRYWRDAWCDGPEYNLTRADLEADDWIVTDWGDREPWPKEAKP